MRERVGNYDTPRPEGPLLWMHGASLGETNALFPVLDRVLELYPDTTIVMTSQTTSAGFGITALFGQDTYRGRCIHVFAPLDTQKAVSRFLDHWQPDAAIFAESEIWPNLLSAMKARGLPSALINARMNRESLKRWAKRVPVAREVFSTFDPILAADQSTEKGLSQLLGRSIEQTGNVKFAFVPPPPKAEDVEVLRVQIGSRRAFAALSVHPGEVPTFNALHSEMGKEGTVMILVPRYPGISASYKGIDEKHTIALGEFGATSLACAVSEFAVMGGSIVANLKGHNPIEAMHLGLPVASGPYVESFADIYADYFEALDTDAQGSLERTKQWFANPKALARDREVAIGFAKRRADIIETVMERLDPLLRALS
jgi:3-deoxy-D-manno-octulosonic-acid transferase